jgi:hypothetical protein
MARSIGRVSPEGDLVKALYKKRLCYVVETGSDVTLDDDGRQFAVQFGDVDLVIDPTDAQVADADNLGELYGIDENATNDIRAMLRGELSAEEWKARRDSRETRPA